jgi:hypothetical protein
MISRFPLTSIMMEERRRWSLWLSDVQTSHLQAITGMPCEVPVPRNVIFKSEFFKYLVKLQNMRLIQCLTNSSGKSLSQS